MAAMYLIGLELILFTLLGLLNSGSSQPRSNRNSGRNNGGGSGGGKRGNHNNNDVSTTGFDINSVIGFELENGKCLNGANYEYFVRPGNPEFVTIIFNGGAFCFNEATCPTDETIPTDAYLYGYFDMIYDLPLTDIDNNFEWTILVFPQCTEDFHIGSNENVILSANTIVNFVGADNVAAVLDAILSKNDSYPVTQYIDFDAVKHINLWGLSSGNIGASAWAFQIFDWVPESSLKTLIIDGWAIGDDIFLGLQSYLDFEYLYDITNSPVYIDELSDIYQAGQLTLTRMVEELQDKYCELFVSSLYFEFDSDQSDIYDYLYKYVLFNYAIDWTSFEVWISHMTNTVLASISGYDSKRSSYYVSKGSNHGFIFPQIDVNVSDIATECEEDLIAQEYLAQVIGNQDIVDLYYGQPQMRVKSFPKYSYNNIDAQCLECL